MAFYCPKQSKLLILMYIQIYIRFKHILLESVRENNEKKKEKIGTDEHFNCIDLCCRLYTLSKCYERSSYLSGRGHGTRF
ncbi:hypothetical protein BACI349Y_640094 [Bacillus sp. 349Y]|nr:hypothetical protein BACI349Y_640094 [Bacillus sp. 349Y]